MVQSAYHPLLHCPPYHLLVFLCDFPLAFLARCHRSRMGILGDNDHGWIDFCICWVRCLDNYEVEGLEGIQGQLGQRQCKVS